MSNFPPLCQDALIPRGRDILLSNSPCIAAAQPRPLGENTDRCIANTMTNKVKCMQESGTETIRIQIQPSKPKREITKITNSQTTKRTYGQPIERLFLPKRWPLSNLNRTKYDMNTRNLKRHRNSDTKNRQQRIATKLPHWNGQ